MKITKEKKLTEVTVYVCEFCDFKSDLYFHTCSHEVSHLNVRNIGDTFAYYVENSNQKSFLENKFGGKWVEQTYPNWFIYYEDKEYDNNRWLPINIYINYINNEIFELKNKIELLEKSKTEIEKIST
jgi:hypothetical protein